MKVTKSGTKKQPRTLTGTCQQCECEVECDESEARFLTDRDSPNGAHYVTCPECSNPWLWVKQIALLLAALLLCSCATDRTTGKKYPISPFAAIVPGDYGY